MMIEEMLIAGFKTSPIQFVTMSLVEHEFRNAKPRVGYEAGAVLAHHLIQPDPDKAFREMCERLECTVDVDYSQMLYRVQKRRKN